MSAAARSFIRSAASRNIRKLDLATGARVSRSTCSPFSTLKQKSLSKRIFRLPVELSCCVEMMLPYHTATASALLTSMLSVSHQSYGWNPEGLESYKMMADCCLRVRYSCDYISWISLNFARPTGRDIVVPLF
ncbi:protein NUCLEAR FUSION DEFECTIVE 6, mitochondrial-like isoform X3 [Prosopis cineraria]|uniref:protein NUCLEAR FUSION DEFECTIVE 6, mitochondrial-like isoform X3 n=1 Tax=Prosopis cineraria TaxID=364024 RepID=UPI002410A81F|nr:protein NUCLEAR FUSION DEFECTIVE 6, mitochondrial-like isoform X3 [Prosopis cineraria]